MNLLDFYCQYPNEASCEEALRRFREHHGLFSSQCGGLRAGIRATSPGRAWIASTRCSFVRVR